MEMRAEISLQSIDDLHYDDSVLSRWSKVMRIEGGARSGLLLACLIAANSAHANSKQNWQDCRADHPDRNITGCTKIIEARGESAKNRALALYLRGSAYGERSDYARALADYDEALKLTPT